MGYKIIVCYNDKKVIGKEGKLLYHIKADMKNFVNMTKDNVVIMGRKTFESLPDKKPLKDRINIIITSCTDYCIETCDNAYIVHTVKEARELCEALFSDKEWFVIGGEAIYQQFLDNDDVDEIIATEVNDDKDGDAFFKWHLNDTIWKRYFETASQRYRSGEDDLSYKFVIYKKKCLTP